MREPIYKGATRPAMLWGVPMVPLLGLSVPVVLIGFWGALLLSIWFAPVMLLLAPLYGWMRYVTYRDDQRLLQMALRFKLNWKTPNRRLWQSRSYSAHRPLGARDVR